MEVYFNRKTFNKHCKIFVFNLSKSFPAHTYDFIVYVCCVGFINGWMLVVFTTGVSVECTCRVSYTFALNWQRNVFFFFLQIAVDTSEKRTKKWNCENLFVGRAIILCRPKGVDFIRSIIAVIIMLPHIESVKMLIEIVLDITVVLLINVEAICNINFVQTWN